MKRPLRVLIAEDSEDDMLLVFRELERAGYEITGRRVQTARDFDFALGDEPWDIVISDYSMPSFNALGALKILKASGLDIPFIVISGTIGEDTAIEALKSGAHDFVVKGRLPRFLPAVERELREAVGRKERRIAEEALRTSERKYRLIVETAQEGIWMIDPEARTTYVNRRMASLLGESAEKLLGRSLLEFTGEWSEVALENLGRCRLGVVDPHEVKLLRAGDSDFWASMSMSPMVDDAGNFHGALVMVTDITEQRLLREQLLVADRMASVGTLAAGVAHEINNPLGAVLLNLHMASKELGTVAPSIEDAAVLSDLRAELQDALEAAERVGSIVRDLRIFSRSDEEKRGPVDIRRVVESCLRMASNEIRHRARLVTQLGNLPPVLANESRLGQVFLNLIVNAAQAIPEGKANENEIRIIAARDDDEWLSVEIADTGSGMAPEVLRRLFTPFFTTKPVGVGTGLGLSICHRIITAVGGKITVDSTVGKGTSFLVVLPVAKEDFLSPIERPSMFAPPSSRRGRVLVVDDEPLAASAARRCLSNEHDVVITGSALDAIERISAGERFDAIICDLMMPQVTGMDLYSELGRIAPELAERMIFLTGGAFTQHAREFLERVNTPRLEKPFNPEALRSLINERVR
ncbi:MAG TPA: response regulator [Polyangiaceae bacterium]|nr:response regulator [Polyangiaceae bacterium]